jgi:hypothetical protein
MAKMHNMHPKGPYRMIEKALAPTMKSGTVTHLLIGGFFVVRYSDDDCAAFSVAGLNNLRVGDMVESELNRVGSTVMRSERNEAFRVLALTGQSCLITCLMLIEDLSARSEAEERLLAMFHGESGAVTLPGAP